MVTIKEVETGIRKAITKHKDQRKVVAVAIESLKPFSGKKITKRMETALKEALPEYTISYRPDYTTYLYVWGNGIDYNERMMLFLGYKQDETFSYEKFLENVKGYDSNENITNLESKLQKLPEIFSQYEDLCDKVQAFNKSLDGLYPLSSMLIIK